MPPTFVLIHSPIVGPDTWDPVVGELTARGHGAVVPALPREVGAEYWRAHVDAVRRAMAGAGTVTIVAHSGAGQLLGPLAAALPDEVTVEAYLLTDAGLPTNGASRMAQLRREAPEFAAELEAVFDAGGRFPDWPDELLASLVPHDERRQRLAAGIRQLPREYWTEPIPDNPHWPDAPVGVLLFSAGYEATATAARRNGWPLRDLQADNHFLLLADPVTVAEELLALRAQLLPV